MTILHVVHCVDCGYVASARTEAAAMAAIVSHAVAVKRGDAAPQKGKAA